MSRYRGKKLVAMDLDGTLTQHKSPLEQDCREALEELSIQYHMLMVCAGGCERVFRQMAGFPIDIAGFYGMQQSAVNNGGLTIVENHTAVIDKGTVLTRAENLRHEFGFLQYAGESIEYHASGMVTFPILGTKAPLKQKLEYDPDRKKRRSCYDRVAEIFHDFTVFIGGTSSFDIVPQPYSKLTALDRYLYIKGLNRADVIYFGDDYETGGNDRGIYESGIDFIAIDNYREFPAAARSLLLE